MIGLQIDNINVPVQITKFSDGGSNVKLLIPQKLKDTPSKNYLSITVATSTPADMYAWLLALTLSAVDEAFPKAAQLHKILYLPYLPHGRADRVFEEGNAAPLKTFFTAFEQVFDEIILTDPHSDFYKQFFGKFTVKPQHVCFLETVEHITSGDTIVAPDSGAINKCLALKEYLHLAGTEVRVIAASKKRDKSTGKIIETTLPNNVKFDEGRVFIVDDICDGGGTFIPLATKLKEAGAKEINLYVTHGIFSKGLSSFQNIIDYIYVYQTIGTYVNKIHISNFNEGII